MSNEINEKIIDKIRKVIELSKNNPSEEEAKAAALKAQKLMAEYHIEIADIESVSEIDEITEMQIDVHKYGKWKKKLANVIAKNFRCKCYYKGSYFVVFYGYSVDCEIAKEVYDYLLLLGTSLATKQYNKYLKEKGTASGVMNTWYLGFLSGVSSELDKQCTALMIVTPPEVESSYEELSKNFRRVSTSLKRNLYMDEVYQDGVNQGKSAMKSRQLEGGN